MDWSAMFPAIGSIAVICYLCAEGLKLIPNFNDRSLPVICGTLGALLGVLGYFLSLSAFAGKEIFDCVATGICSGLVSCGTWDLIDSLKTKNNN